MKYGFYFRLYKKIPNDVICTVLSNLAYAIYCCLFFVKSINRKRHISLCNIKEAKKRIDDIYPRLNDNPQYINPTINNDIDLSVIMPIYNYAKIIRDTINAIINQKTSYRYEIILIDDGSTDGAADIIREFEKNLKIKAIFQKNAGIGAARNAGINFADGRYIMFIDCDDVVHDDIVETLMQKAYSNDYDMVMCAHNLSKENNGIIYEKIPNVYSKYNLMGYKNGDKIMNLPGLPWCKVYKRKIWDQVRFFPGYWYEDTIIQFLIFPQCKNYAYISKIEYEYKWYEKNFSHIQGDSTKIKTIDSYWLLVEILEQYNRIGLPQDDVLYTLLLRHISSYYYSSIKGLDDKLIEALFVAAKEMYTKYKPSHKVKLTYMLRQVEKSFDRNDFELWKLASLYQ